jgi:hypothetical protein
VLVEVLVMELAVEGSREREEEENGASEDGLERGAS